MTTLEDIMRGPRLKVQRANRHIDELIRRTAPIDPQLYELRVRKVPRSVIHLDATEFELAYRPKKPIPETLGLIIGDAVHNLRAALDHFANVVIRTWLPANGKRAFFPMSSKWENFVSHSDFPAIEEALPDTKDLLLKEVRPKDGPNEALWSFNTLDNDDKHNLILPTVAFADISNINITTGGGVLRNCGAGSDAARPMVILRSSWPITMHNDLNPAVDVKFGKGSPFENEPVIPTLTQISKLVDETLSILERHVRDTKF